MLEQRRERHPVLRGSPGRLTALVAEGLKEKLFDGHMVPGERFCIEDLRLEYRASKQPIMEALRLLSADGLVEIVPQVGSQVRIYPQRDIVDFYGMLASVEGAIAAGAAERRSLTQLDELQLLSKTMSNLVGAPDALGQSSEYRELNRKWHRQVHLMADSLILSDTAERLWDLNDFFIGTYSKRLMASEVMGSRHGEHATILRAVMQGDPQAARAEMVSHVLSIRELFVTDGHPLTGSLQEVGDA